MTVVVVVVLGAAAVVVVVVVVVVVYLLRKFCTMVSILCGSVVLLNSMKTANVTLRPETALSN